MKYLLKEWKTIKRALGEKYIYLLLDFDGTLTRIRKRPGEVKLSKATKSVLKGLVSQKKASVAIISGRSLKDARRMVGLKDLVYAGNHGLETKGPGFQHTIPKALRAKKAIKEISRELKRRLKPLKGVIIEDKGLTLSVHYRMVPAGKVKEA
ncbi:MAG: trehalose-phosphatase, partial [Candidatus Omnitrophota bacterium]